MAKDKFGDSCWTGNTSLRCIGVCDETKDVKSFFFRPDTPEDQPQQFIYIPGQFITLELNIEGKRVCRCYTLSSSSCRPYVASITVKRQPNGLVSNYLHDNLKAGMQIKALSATGDFSYLIHNIKENKKEKYLFLSGGSGITPLMSMSRYMYDLRSQYDVAFLHSARTPDDIIFYDELKSIARSMNFFKLSLFCDTIGDKKEWDGFLGFINYSSLLAAVPDFIDRSVFCCGPPAYMKNIRSILQKSNYNMNKYFQESFNFDEKATNTTKEQKKNEVVTNVKYNSSLDKSNEIGKKTFTICFKDMDKTIECPEDSTVLEAARDQGIQRSFMCSQGICGTCKSKLISGEVDMQHNGGIRESAIDDGYFLPCCSFPLSDITME